MRYSYTGKEDFLLNETALGRIVDGKFKVQVDRFDHEYSHGWWEQKEEDWTPMDPVDWSDVE